jgi:hypothetical protein
MTIVKQCLLVVAVILLVASTAPAQKVGSTAMQFLHVMPSARGTAMGDAYSVLATGSDAIFWNPAGCADISVQEFSSTYVNWIFDTRQGAISYARPMGSIGSLGVQLQYVDFGEFEETSSLPPYIKNPDEPGATGRTFRPFSYLLGLTYARNLTDRFSTGLSVKYAHESLFNGSPVVAQVSQGVYETVNTWATGVLFDFGIRYTTGYRSVQLGVAVQNFGADIQYAKESNPAPLLFRFGIAGDLIGPDALLISGEKDNTLRLAFDLFQPNDYTQQEHLGMEYVYGGTFAVRAGYKFNYDSEGFTAGAGIQQPVGPIKLALDYSYGSVGTWLGNVQRISLGAIIP